jgi:hypothetical protein
MRNDDLRAVFPYQREYRCCVAACLQNTDLAKLTSARITARRNPAAKDKPTRSDLRRLLDAGAPAEFGTFLPSSPADPLSCEANGAFAARPGDRSAPSKLEVAVSGADGATHPVEGNVEARSTSAAAIGPREQPSPGPRSVWAEAQLMAAFTPRLSPAKISRLPRAERW